MPLASLDSFSLRLFCDLHVCIDSSLQEDALYTPNGPVQLKPFQHLPIVVNVVPSYLFSHYLDTHARKGGGVCFSEGCPRGTGEGGGWLCPPNGNGERGKA